MVSECIAWDVFRALLCEAVSKVDIQTRSLIARNSYTGQTTCPT
jgi:hypothetical protein